MGAKGGERYPVQAYGTFGWDGTQWLKIITSAGGIAVEVRGWGDPPVSLTPRDVSLDFQALTDDAIKGLMRTLGDAGAAPLNSAGNTVLQWLFEIEETVGPTAAGPTNAVNNYTVRRFLELILAALGGTVDESHESIAIVAPGGGGDSAAQVFSVNQEALLVLCETADGEIRTRKTDGVTWNATYVVAKRNSVVAIPVACSAFVVRNRGGAAGPPNASFTVTGFSN